MRGDRVHDLEGKAVARRDGRADRRVRTLDLVVDRLAHVVEEAAGLRGQHVSPELRGDDRGEAAGLDDVVQHVLAVAGAELEASEEARDLGRQAGHAGVVRGRVAGLADDQVHLGASLRHDLLDPAGMDPPVGHQLGQRDAGDLAPDGIEAREDHGLGRVVDDQVHAGCLLEGPDVAALAADDPALHLV